MFNNNQYSFPNKNENLESIIESLIGYIKPRPLFSVEKEILIPLSSRAANIAVEEAGKCFEIDEEKAIALCNISLLLFLTSYECYNANILPSRFYLSRIFSLYKNKRFDFINHVFLNKEQNLLSSFTYDVYIIKDITISHNPNIGYAIIKTAQNFIQANMFNFAYEILSKLIIKIEQELELFWGGSSFNISFDLSKIKILVDKLKVVDKKQVEEVFELAYKIQNVVIKFVHNNKEKEPRCYYSNWKTIKPLVGKTLDINESFNGFVQIYSSHYSLFKDSLPHDLSEDEFKKLHDEIASKTQEYLYSDIDESETNPIVKSIIKHYQKVPNDEITNKYNKRHHPPYSSAEVNYNSFKNFVNSIVKPSVKTLEIEKKHNIKINYTLKSSNVFDASILQMKTNEVVSVVIAINRHIFESVRFSIELKSSPIFWATYYGDKNIHRLSKVMAYFEPLLLMRYFNPLHNEAYLPIMDLTADHDYEGFVTVVSRSLLLFLVFHEIAHISNKDNSEVDVNKEYKADKQALKWIMQLRKSYNEETSEFYYFPVQYTCFMLIFDVLFFEEQAKGVNNFAYERFCKLYDSIFNEYYPILTSDEKMSLQEQYNVLTQFHNTTILNDLYELTKHKAILPNGEFDYLWVTDVISSYFEEHN